MWPIARSHPYRAAAIGDEGRTARNSIVFNSDSAVLVRGNELITASISCRFDKRPSANRIKSFVFSL